VTFPDQAGVLGIGQLTDKVWSQSLSVDKNSMGQFYVRSWVRSGLNLRLAPSQLLTQAV
jgi:hypothetical protein